MSSQYTSPRFALQIRSWLGLAAAVVLSWSASGRGTRLPNEVLATDHISNITTATYLGNDEVIVRSKKPLLIGVDALELAVLARAAQEVQLRGETDFIIRRVEFRQDFDILRPDLPLALDQPIASFAEFRTVRDEATSMIGRVRSIVIVIEIVDEEEYPFANTMDAAETYSALREAWIDRFLR